MLAVENLPMTPRELRNLVIAGFKGSFFPATTPPSGPTSAR
jgi:hypothetical protein